MKKKCKSCKSKKMEELNQFDTNEKTNPLVYVLLILYTILAGYGLVTLINDISNFITQLF